MGKNISSTIKKLLLEHGPQSSTIFVNLISKKTELPERNVRYRLKKLYVNDKVEWLKRHPEDWDKKGDVWYYHSGQEKLLEEMKGVLIGQRKETVTVKEDVKKEEKTIGDEHLQLQISHTKKVQRKVIAHIYKAFKCIRYGEDIHMTLDEVEGFAEDGPPYFKIYFGGEGMDVPLNRIVKEVTLLEDYMKNHAPALFEAINEFNKKYREYWKIYFKINNQIRKIIKTRMGMPITHFSRWGDMYDFWRFNWFVIPQSRIPPCPEKPKTISTKKVEGVPSNLQYELSNALLYGDRLFDHDNFLPIQFFIKRRGEVYECWSSNMDPPKCYLREKCRGRSKKDFYKEVEEKIRKTVRDIANSTQLQKLSNEIQSLMKDLWKRQYEILRILEMDLNKEVLDGFCDYCVHKKEMEKEKRKEDFKFDLLHKYYHEGLR